MFPYWLLFAYFAVGTLVSARPVGATRNPRPLGLLLGLVLVAVMIGTRDRVGADWTGYLHMFRWAEIHSWTEQLELGDPGYQTLNWVVSELGGEIWTVNLICGSIFSYGLWRLARQQPEPWLAVLVAFPYLTVVVAMGYARQGVAIGILLAGLAAISRDRSAVKFVVYVAIAASFHSTALFALPLTLFGSQRSTLLNFFLVLLFGLVGYQVFLSGNIDHFVSGYLRVRYDSQGALIRVIMCVIPAIVFFLGSSRMGFSDFERGMWRNFSVMALLLFLALFLAPSSTAIDRLALYVLPLQIAVLARAPKLLGAPILPRVMVIAYMAAVLFTWLNFAVHANAWIPYRSYLWS